MLELPPADAAVWCLSVAAALLPVSGALARQGEDPFESRAVVQPIPNSASLNLNAALTRLGQNPRDVTALTDAGNAALDIGDVDAAIGFFRRADQIAPNHAPAKAGLARALVRSGNPFEAIPLFEAAERAGAADSAFALDRGLAHDLVGDNGTAQRFYRQALAGGADDEATRRLALSLAIAGDRRGSESAISPLLQRGDKAAWRTRAFALAILGRTDEAIAVANGTLPPDLAAGIAPYLRYMPRLTPAQQAAAANFGQFPRASEIGRDDPRVAQFSRSQPRPTVASADAGLIPSGEPLGRRDRPRRNNPERRESQARQSDGPLALAANAQPRPRVPDARVAPPELQAARVAPPPEPQPARVATPPVSAPAMAAAALPATPAPRPVSIAPPAAPQSAAVTPTRPAAEAAPPPVGGSPVPAPGFDLSASSATPMRSAAASGQAPSRDPATAPAPSGGPSPVSTPAAPPAPPPSRPSLAEAFSDLAPPATDATPAAGAVDIRTIRPVRETAQPPRPTPPSHPSRIWVQVATGRDKTALGFDWRRMTRAAQAVFRGRQPFVSAWGQTHRLLTGPFASEAAANAFIAQLRREDLAGAFVWTSPAGHVVDALAVR